MPITMRVPIKRLTQPEFGEISYEVMKHVFEIHKEVGRYEAIYKSELAYRIPGTLLEEPIDVSFESFHKLYYVDVLTAGGGIFEFKAADAISGRHRAQLLNYLRLCDVTHGKVINVRSERIDHEFVNNQRLLTDRLKFEVNTDRRDRSIVGAARLEDELTKCLCDLGTGLEIGLYEEFLVHLFGGTERVDVKLPVKIRGRAAGIQPLKLLAPGVSFKVTGFENSLEAFEYHERRLLSHVELEAITWINITLSRITFTTLKR